MIHPQIKGFHDLPSFLAAADLASDLRPWPVTGDMMAPQINRGDFLFCRPVDRYIGERTYVMLFGSITYADRFGGEVRMTYANKRYSPRLVSAAWFDFHVLAVSLYALQCWDPAASRLMEATLATDMRARS